MEKLLFVEEFILTDPNLTPTPIFYQHMTDLVFRGLISNHLIGFTEDSTTPAVLDHEGGALRYAAAYVYDKRLSMGTTSLRRNLYFA